MQTEAILLVEDDENDAFFIERAMDEKGMATPCRNTRDGQEALYTSFQLRPPSSGRTFVRRHGV